MVAASVVTIIVVSGSGVGVGETSGVTMAVGSTVNDDCATSVDKDTLVWSSLSELEYQGKFQCTIN